VDRGRERAKVVDTVTIILVCKWFANPRTGKRELLIDRATRDDGCAVVFPAVHPSDAGAVFDKELGEWVIDERGDR
jgi:hypothetical protein